MQDKPNVPGSLQSQQPEALHEASNVEEDSLHRSSYEPPTKPATPMSTRSTERDIYDLWRMADDRPRRWRSVKFGDLFEVQKVRPLRRCSRSGGGC